MFDSNFAWKCFAELDGIWRWVRVCVADIYIVSNLLGVQRGWKMEKKKYPMTADHYALYEEVGSGVSATVHRALCITLNEIVAIKIMDFERENCDLVNFLLFIIIYMYYLPAK